MTQGVNKILLSIFVLFLSLSFFSIPKTTAEDRKPDQELGVNYETSAKLHFIGLGNVFLEVNFKRYFLNELEYEFLIVGKIGYDDTSKMFKLDIQRQLSKLLKAPYSKSAIPFTKQYGVIKLMNTLDRENDYTISILSDDENTDPIFMAPAIKSLQIPIRMPGEAITDPSRKNNNFPNIEFSDEKKEAYPPFELFTNPVALNESLKYEIVSQEGNRDLISILYNTPLSPYQLFPNYRLVEDPINNTAKILKTVYFLERNTDYFNNYILDIPVVDISGVSLTDSTNHQVTISGKLDTTEKTNITFLATNNEANLNLDRPISIIDFSASSDQIKKINYKSEEQIKGPPVFLNWEISPKENVEIKLINSSNEVIYEGTETTKENLEVIKFKPGKYRLIMKNSLGGKIVELDIAPPEPRIEIKISENVGLDEFNNVAQEISLDTAISFEENNLLKQIIVYLYGNTVTNLFSLPYGYNQNKTVIIREIEKKELAPGYLNRYVYEIRQIKGDPNDLIVSFSSAGLKEDISVNLLDEIKSPQGIIKKSDLVNIFSEGNSFPKNDFFEEEKANEDFLVFKSNLTPTDFDSITDQQKKIQLLNLWQKSISEITKDPFLNGVSEGSGNENGSAANLLGASIFSKNYGILDVRTLIITSLLTSLLLISIFFFTYRNKK